MFGCIKPIERAALSVMAITVCLVMLAIVIQERRAYRATVDEWIGGQPSEKPAAVGVDEVDSVAVEFDRCVWKLDDQQRNGDRRTLTGKCDAVVTMRPGSDGKPVDAGTIVARVVERMNRRHSTGGAAQSP